MAILEQRYPVVVVLVLVPVVVVFVIVIVIVVVVDDVAAALAGLGLAIGLLVCQAVQPPLELAHCLVVHAAGVVGEGEGEAGGFAVEEGELDLELGVGGDGGGERRVGGGGRHCGGCGGGGGE